MSRPVKYFWEDFRLEERVCMGSVSVELGEVLDFAKRFDPQPFHVDAAQAKNQFMATSLRVAGIPARW